MGIANPQGKVVEHFLTADCKPDVRMGIANPQREVVEHFFDSGLQIRWNAWRETY